MRSEPRVSAPCSLGAGEAGPESERALDICCPAPCPTGTPEVQACTPLCVHQDPTFSPSPRPCVWSLNVPTRAEWLQTLGCPSFPKEASSVGGARPGSAQRAQARPAGARRLLSLPFFTSRAHTGSCVSSALTPPRVEPLQLEGDQTERCLSAPRGGCGRRQMATGHVLGNGDTLRACGALFRLLRVSLSVSLSLSASSTRLALCVRGECGARRNPVEEMPWLADPDSLPKILSSNLQFGR